MSKFILSSHQDNEIFISNIQVDELIDLSDKVFCNKYGRKSKIRIIEDAKLGNERNYRLVLQFAAGLVKIQLQSLPITSNQVKQYGFNSDEAIDKYKDLGLMLKRLEE
jgi:hypothetical protein